MKKLFITGGVSACLLLLMGGEIMAQGSAKAVGNSTTGELTVSDVGTDYPGYLSVEPNPAHKSCKVHCTPNLKEGKIIIYDLRGKVMAAFDDVRSGMVSLDEKNLPAGVYLLQLRSNDTTIQTRRIVVQ